MNKRNRPVTAVQDYNHKLYERASKLWERETEHNIESMQINIENKMVTAEQKKKERVGKISHRIRVDNYKKEQLQLQKLKIMDDALNPVIKTKKKGEFDSGSSDPYKANTSRAYPSGTSSDQKPLKKVQSQKQIQFKSLSRATGGPDIETGDLLGLVESHLIQPGPMAPIDIKAGQNMIKS